MNSPVSQKWSMKDGLLFSNGRRSPPQPQCVIFMIFVSLENVRKYSHEVARLPQRLKSMLFEIFSHSEYPSPSGTLCSKKFQTTLILAFEANSALSHKNETKIVTITHSGTGLAEKINV